MNNMTQKMINDGIETRRAKYNMITVIIGTAMLLIIKGISVEYIDADGILRENFFLAPCGFLCLFCGSAALRSAGIRSVIAGIKKL